MSTFKPLLLGAVISCFSTSTMANGQMPSIMDYLGERNTKPSRTVDRYDRGESIPAPQAAQTQRSTSSQGQMTANPKNRSSFSDHSNTRMTYHKNSSRSVSTPTETRSTAGNNSSPRSDFNQSETRSTAGTASAPRSNFNQSETRSTAGNTSAPRPDLNRSETRNAPASTNRRSFDSGSGLGDATLYAETLDQRGMTTTKAQRSLQRYDNSIKQARTKLSSGNLTPEGRKAQENYIRKMTQGKRNMEHYLRGKSGNPQPKSSDYRTPSSQSTARPAYHSSVQLDEDY